MLFRTIFVKSCIVPFNATLVLDLLFFCCLLACLFVCLVVWLFGCLFGLFVSEKHKIRIKEKEKEKK
jgi:hypothetical protein